MPEWHSGETNCCYQSVIWWCKISHAASRETFWEFKAATFLLTVTFFMLPLADVVGDLNTATKSMTSLCSLTEPWTLTEWLWIFKERQFVRLEINAKNSKVLLSRHFLSTGRTSRMSIHLSISVAMFLSTMARSLMSPDVLTALDLPLLLCLKFGCADSSIYTKNTKAVLKRAEILKGWHFHRK